MRRIADAYFTSMWFERNMNCMGVGESKREEELMTHTAKMTCNMVALRAGRSTVLPSAGEAEIVSALPADVVIAEMVVESLGVGVSSCAVEPETAVGCCGIGRLDGGRDGGRWGKGGCHCERVEIELEDVEGHERSVG